MLIHRHFAMKFVEDDKKSNMVKNKNKKEEVKENKRILQTVATFHLNVTKRWGFSSCTAKSKSKDAYRIFIFKRFSYLKTLQL